MDLSFYNNFLNNPFNASGSPDSLSCSISSCSLAVNIPPATDAAVIAFNGDNSPPEPNIPFVAAILDISSPPGLIIDSGLPNAMFLKPSLLNMSLAPPRKAVGLVKPVKNL